MAGKLSNLVTYQQKRKQSATGGEHAKKLCRPSQRSSTARPTNCVAVPVAPLQGVNGSAMAMAFPVVGVNGVAPRWSTAVALGAPSRAAGLPLPVMVSAKGPAALLLLAPAHGLQTPVSAGNSAARARPMSSVNGVAAPQVLGREAGQLVPVPLQFFGYEPMAGVSGAPTPAVGRPLAAALARFENSTLGRMLSALMPVCDPPLRQHESKTDAQPPWWPTASEHWWAPEVVAHLAKMPMNTPVPFLAGSSLKKAQKVAVLVAIVKHLAPDFARIASAASHSRLSNTDAALWNSALQNECAKYMTPVFILQQQPNGDGHRLAPSRIAAADAGEQVVNFRGASVTAPAEDGGQVVAAAEPERQQRQDRDGVLHGIVVAADNGPADDGREQHISFPGDDGERLGATVTAPTDEIHQVAAEPELQPEQHGDAHATDVAAAAELGEQQLEDMLAPLQVQQGEEIHQMADMEASGPAAERPWYENDELRHRIANFEIPRGMSLSFYDGWF